MRSENFGDILSIRGIRIIDWSEGDVVERREREGSPIKQNYPFVIVLQSAAPTLLFLRPVHFDRWSEISHCLGHLRRLVGACFATSPTFPHQVKLETRSKKKRAPVRPVSTLNRGLSELSWVVNQDGLQALALLGQSHLPVGRSFVIVRRLAHESFLWPVASLCPLSIRQGG